jgi:glycerol-3-phosphate acyltransferase PlsY
VFFTIGIASITTISIAVFVTLVFAVRAYMELSPWVDVIYGLIATFLLIWALRPNIKKLIEGNERVVGISLYGKIKARREQAETK